MNDETFTLKDLEKIYTACRREGSRWSRMAMETDRAYLPIQAKAERDMARYFYDLANRVEKEQRAMFQRIFFDGITDAEAEARRIRQLELDNARLVA